MRTLIILIVCVIAASCTRSLQCMYRDGHVKRTNNPPVPASFYKEEPYTIRAASGVSADIHYLGCGGFFIQSATGSVLIDPFFSNKRFWFVPFTRLRVKTKVIRNALDTHKAAIREGVEALLVSHSHYDHLLDVPYVFHQYCNTAAAQVVTSHSGERLVGSVITNIIDVEDSVWTVNDSGSILSFNDGLVRVYPILTDHAPHFGNIKLYDGEARPMKRYHSPTKKTWATKWKNGMTLAYLVDIFSPGKTDTLRIYVQTSAAAPPNGHLPQSVLDEHPINVALLAAASFKYTDHYPEELVQHLHPEYIGICHWEDFFLRYERRKKRIVRFTNLKEFVRRLNVVYPWEQGGVKDRFILLKPGVKVTVE